MCKKIYYHRYNWTLSQMADIVDTAWEDWSHRIIDYDDYKTCSTVDVFDNMSYWSQRFNTKDSYSVLYLYNCGAYYMILNKMSLPNIDVTHRDSITATQLKHHEPYFLWHSKKVARKIVRDDGITVRLWWNPAHLRCQTNWEKDDQEFNGVFGGTSSFLCIGYCTTAWQLDKPREERNFLARW